MRLRLFFIVALAIAIVAGCTGLELSSGDRYPSESGIVSANGIQIAYESYGSHDREVILLIGGTGSQLIDWPLELVDELVRRSYRVVRFDNRDAGLSTHITAAGAPDYQVLTDALQTGERIPSPYRLDDMARDTVGLLDALDIDRAHIVGVSMGGAIAQLLAIEYPKRVRSLTLIMSDSGNPAIPIFAQPEALAGIPPLPKAGDRDGFISYQVKSEQVIAGPAFPPDEKILRDKVEQKINRSFDIEAFSRQQYVALVGYIEGGTGRYAKLKSILAPTVILHGDSDKLVATSFAQDLSTQIPGAELIIYKGLGHDLPVQLSETIADAITRAATKK